MENIASQCPCEYRMNEWIQRGQGYNAWHKVCACSFLIHPFLCRPLGSIFETVISKEGISPLGALGHLCQIAEKGWDQPFMSKDLRKILLGRKEKGKMVEVLGS